MANPFRRGWKYFMAMLSGRIDERADPRIQIQQALEEAQNNHQALTQQAAAVIGNQRQLEMKLARQMSEVEKLQASARQALTMADAARAAGDEAKAAEYEQSAQAFASRLVGAESSMEDLKQLHDQALAAAAQAKKAVEQNALKVEQQMAQRSKLLTQLESAKMQEQVAANLSQMSELAAPKDVPTLDEVRDKIERRYATALGRSELAGSSVQGRMAEVEAAAVDVAGSVRLDQIRASLRGEQLAVPPAAAAGSIAPISAGTTGASTAGPGPVPNAQPETPAAEADKA